MPNRDEGLVFPSSLELEGRDRVKGTICPDSVSTMKCDWPMHDDASQRQIFEKRTSLSLSGAFAVPDCILGIIAISRFPKIKESWLSGTFLSVTKIRQARRVIDGSVIDTVGAGRFLKLIDAGPGLYRLSVQGGCGLCRA
jgi:hypothetical protein